MADAERPAVTGVGPTGVVDKPERVTLKTAQPLGLQVEGVAPIVVAEAAARPAVTADLPTEVAEAQPPTELAAPLPAEGAAAPPAETEIGAPVFRIPDDVKTDLARHRKVAKSKRNEEWNTRLAELEAELEMTHESPTIQRLSLPNLADRAAATITYQIPDALAEVRGRLDRIATVKRIHETQAGKVDTMDRLLQRNALTREVAEAEGYVREAEKELRKAETERDRFVRKHEGVQERRTKWTAWQEADVKLKQELTDVGVEATPADLLRRVLDHSSNQPRFSEDQITEIEELNRLDANEAEVTIALEGTPDAPREYLKTAELSEAEVAILTRDGKPPAENTDKEGYLLGTAGERIEKGRGRRLGAKGYLKDAQRRLEKWEARNRRVESQYTPEEEALLEVQKRLSAVTGLVSQYQYGYVADVQEMREEIESLLAERKKIEDQRDKYADRLWTKTSPKKQRQDLEAAKRVAEADLAENQEAEVRLRRNIEIAADPTQIAEIIPEDDREFAQQVAPFTQAVAALAAKEPIEVAGLSLEDRTNYRIAAVLLGSEVLTTHPELRPILEGKIIRSPEKPTEEPPVEEPPPTGPTGEGVKEEVAGEQNAHPGVTVEALARYTLEDLIALASQPLAQGERRAAFIQAAIQAHPDQVQAFVDGGAFTADEIVTAIGEPLADDAPEEIRQTVTSEATEFLQSLSGHLEGTYGEEFSPEDARQALETGLPQLEGNLPEGVTREHALRQLAEQVNTALKTPNLPPKQRKQLVNILTCLGLVAFLPLAGAGASKEQ